MHRFSKTAKIKNVHKKYFGLIFNPNVNLSAKFTRCCSYLEMFFVFPIFIFSQIQLFFCEITQCSIYKVSFFSCFALISLVYSSFSRFTGNITNILQKNFLGRIANINIFCYRIMLHLRATAPSGVLIFFYYYYFGSVIKQ